MLGFLSPSGEFHECGQYWHIELADKLLQKHYGICQVNSVDNLCRLGWVAIQDSFVGFAGSAIQHEPQLTESQKTWLIENRKDMSIQQNKSIDLCLEVDDVLCNLKK